MSYFYGPVPSRRLGFSLGVDLVPFKRCTFDCIYCQLGSTTRKTLRRFSYVDLEMLSRQFKKILDQHPRIDYLTLAGSGEPTLHKDLDKIIALLKKRSDDKIPVCVITNSSLLYRKKVRQELLGADLIIPSLDAVTPSLFRKINRPCKGITADKVISGLIKLRKEFKGKIWLEIMLVAGINDTENEAEKFKKVIELIGPDKVQLNLPVRPSEAKTEVPAQAKIKKVRKILSGSAEIVSPFPERKQKKMAQGQAELILEYVKRRPATLRDLSSSLGAHEQELLKSISLLLKEKKIKTEKFKGKVFYSG